MNINTKEDTHRGIKMKNINEMLQLINEVNGYSDREAFSSKIFDIYNHIKENPNKDLKLFFIEYALLCFMMFSGLCRNRLPTSSIQKNLKMVNLQ